MLILKYKNCFANDPRIQKREVLVYSHSKQSLNHKQIIFLFWHGSGSPRPNYSHRTQGVELKSLSRGRVNTGILGYAEHIYIMSVTPKSHWLSFKAVTIKRQHNSRTTNIITYDSITAIINVAHNHP